MSNLVMLNWRPFEYKATFEKIYRYRGIDILDIFFKRLYEESLEDLQINSN